MSRNIEQLDPCLERTFRGHKNYITSVAFSPSLRQLASGSADKTIMLWNFKPQLRAFRFVGHEVGRKREKKRKRSSICLILIVI